MSNPHIIQSDHGYSFLLSVVKRGTGGGTDLCLKQDTAKICPCSKYSSIFSSERSLVSGRNRITTKMATNMMKENVHQAPSLFIGGLEQYLKHSVMMVANDQLVKVAMLPARVRTRFGISSDMEVHGMGSHPREKLMMKMMIHTMARIPNLVVLQGKC